MRASAFVGWLRDTGPMSSPRTVRQKTTRQSSRAVHRIAIRPRPSMLDPAGLEAAEALRAAGLNDVTSVGLKRVWFLEGDLDTDTLHRAAVDVLADPVQDEFAINRRLPTRKRTSKKAKQTRAHAVTVMRKSGVTHPEAESARIALEAMDIPALRVHSAHTFSIQTSASKHDVLAMARRALGNDVIEDVRYGEVRDYEFPADTKADISRYTIDIQDITDAELMEISGSMGLSLNLAEMRAIQAHFDELGRAPTDVELETLAQTWSEHCKHKTLAGAVVMTDERGTRRYKNLLKETVFAATKKLNKSWCLSVFEDNAGVIGFDDDDGVCMKVETHNHPSAIEPYGGAGTGIGGVIRDILGTGKGAKPVANTDVFCFGDPYVANEDLPSGTMHPMRLLRGVVSGVRDYGNRMGIPTVNGAVLFDPRYVGNPVVYCGCVGLIPRNRIKKAARPGDLIVAFGGRTGRDGIHGATFSSVELSSDSEMVSSGAVQIGDPITEKKVLDVLLQARDRGMFNAVTDCGAGGFSSAVGEMGEKVGADVDLSAAPLKYPGLSGFEIWISEAQERMVAAISPKKWKAFQTLCESEHVEACVLGTFTGDKRLTVRHGKTLLADLSMSFLHDGLPKLVREATFATIKNDEPTWKPKTNYTSDLRKLLGLPQIGSKEWVIRQYDHEVQAGAVVRPLTGPNQGPSDAAVIAPKLGSKRGIVLSGGINPAYGDIDPHAMAMGAVDEAIRNAVCVGADPSRMAILDNFTWGNCNREETLGSIVRAAEGCHDAAMLFGTPFISGKDSLNNEYRTDDGELIVVPPTLLISAIGVISDVRKTCTSDLKRAGNWIYIVGETHDECGGSHWYRLRGKVGSNVPTVAKSAPRTMRTVSRLVRRGMIRAAHDLSEGGLAVALAEMAFASNLGADVSLSSMPATTKHPGRRLFSESNSRFIVEVTSKHKKDVEALLRDKKIPFGRLGRVTEEKRVVIRNRARDDDALINSSTKALRRAWRTALPIPGQD